MNQYPVIKPQQFTRKKIEQYSYGLNDVIGKGYSSQVYKGRHEHSEEPVAVKVIDMKMLKNEINRHLLESEIEILKEIKDVPNVLKFHEVYTTKNNTYIITELCSSDLSKKIHQKLTQAEAFHFMDQVIQGYFQIYQKQIVHRDLKPANILLTENDECKIADFGFAIKNEKLSRPSQYNVGSPLYMAPESLKRNQYSYKTDIWSVGVIFFQLLTGETPWKCKTEKDLLRKIETQTIESIIERKKLNFSSKAVDFLARCFLIDPHQRLSPEDLRKYKFSISVPKNILTETKMNETVQKSAKLLNISITSPANKTFQSKKFIAFLTPSSKNISQNTCFSTTYKLNQTQQLSLNNKSEAQKDNQKLISKQLISEIHFCRLLFKLLQKIKSSQKKGMLRVCADESIAVQKKFTQFIRHKLDNLTTFGSHNFLDVQQSDYLEYKQSTDYKKIMKIAREYKERYQIELQQHWNSSFDKKFTTSETLSLIKKMTDTFDKKDREQMELNLAQYEKDVVILDYLITVKQLLEMLADGENYEKFSRKSRIQDIVQGTTFTITYEMYQKIIHRAKKVILY